MCILRNRFINYYDSVVYKPWCNTRKITWWCTRVSLVRSCAASPSSLCITDLLPTITACQPGLLSSGLLEGITAASTAVLLARRHLAVGLTLLFPIPGKRSMTHFSFSNKNLYSNCCSSFFGWDSFFRDIFLLAVLVYGYYLLVFVCACSCISLIPSVKHKAYSLAGQTLLFNAHIIRHVCKTLTLLSTAVTILFKILMA